MTDIEKVARALAMAHCKAGGAIPLHASGVPMDWPEYVESSWRFFLFPARIAVEALWEPTAEIMMIGGLNAPGMGDEPTTPELRELADRVWKAMIGAILNEKAS